jgi:hypothetical protein
MKLFNLKFHKYFIWSFLPLKVMKLCACLNTCIQRRDKGVLHGYVALLSHVSMFLPQTTIALIKGTIYFLFLNHLLPDIAMSSPTL